MNSDARLQHYIMSDSCETYVWNYYTQCVQKLYTDGLRDISLGVDIGFCMCLSLVSVCNVFYVRVGFCIFWFGDVLQFETLYLRYFLTVQSICSNLCTV